jgi:hypothetical protein
VSMELITTAPLQEGMYEALVVNYETPGAPPCYWTDVWRARLTEETQRRCLTHYPVAPPKPSGKAQSGIQATLGGPRSIQQSIRQGLEGTSSGPWGHPKGNPVAVAQELKSRKPRVGECLAQEATGAGHKAPAPSRPGGPEGKARKGPHKNHLKVKSALTSGKTRAALKQKGKGDNPAFSKVTGLNPVPPPGSDEEQGSEGESDDAERDVNLWAKEGSLDPPGVKQGAGASAPPEVTPKGRRPGLGGEAWGVALAIAKGLRDPLLVTRTDTQLIKKMELERRIGGWILPALRSRDARISQARAEAKLQGPPISQVSSPTGGRDIVTSREVGAGETLLVPFGVIRAKRVPVEWDPEGRRDLPMGTGGFLLIST